MTITKTAYAVTASASVAAAGSNTSSAIDLTTEKGCVITAKITNGATGPTVPCTCYIEVSNDNTNWKIWRSGQGDTTASIVRTFAFTLPKEIMYARVRFTDNTVQAVTVEAQGMSYDES